MNRTWLILSWTFVEIFLCFEFSHEWSINSICAEFSSKLRILKQNYDNNSEQCRQQSNHASSINQIAVDKTNSARCRDQESINWTNFVFFSRHSIDVKENARQDSN